MSAAQNFLHVMLGFIIFPKLLTNCLDNMPGKKSWPAQTQIFWGPCLLFLQVCSAVAQNPAT